MDGVYQGLEYFSEESERGLNCHVGQVPRCEGRKRAEFFGFSNHCTTIPGFPPVKASRSPDTRHHGSIRCRPPGQDLPFVNPPSSDTYIEETRA